ncbi:hypothetical protein K443DRAFT_602679 [Laccaria amethystina LaAM-08-1]|uniref:Uncharacterized protein n=1 Tax=Laccaria amethystina LaAM-08-1 TaxID=1095629 RepID=A0A0C9WQF5_9AGAR|nr:hypothetical protein K443DRAFT_602679 [Laccaria amethystina LaAM-08-1]
MVGKVLLTPLPSKIPGVSDEKRWESLLINARKWVSGIPDGHLCWAYHYYPILPPPLTVFNTSHTDFRPAVHLPPPTGAFRPRSTPSHNLSLRTVPLP